MTTDDVRAILARAELVTGGPWVSGYEETRDSERSHCVVRDEIGRALFDTINSDARALAVEPDEAFVRYYDVLGKKNLDFAASARTDVPALATELLIAWEHVDVLKGDEYALGVQDGRQAVLGERAEGEVWTVELTRARWLDSCGPPGYDPHRGDRQATTRVWLLRAIAEGRCDDPRRCCEIVTESTQ